MSLSTIFCAVEAAFKVPRAEILSETRKRPVRDARFAMAALLRERGLSLGQIAIILRRDLSTISEAVRRARTLEADNAAYGQALQTARQISKDGAAAARLAAAALQPPKPKRPPVSEIEPTVSSAEFSPWEMRAHVNQASQRMAELLQLEKADA